MHKIKTVLSDDALEKQINILAKKITKDYQNKNLLLIGILKGSVIFLSDLVRELWRQGLTDCELDFMGISSYGKDTESSKNPHITKDLDTDIREKHILLVEDIVDTGYSLDALRRILLQRQPASLKTVVLLSKDTRREVDVPIEYIGFKIDGWVEGYGLDTDELYRGRPEVVEVIDP